MVTFPNKESCFVNSLFYSSLRSSQTQKLRSPLFKSRPKAIVFLLVRNDSVGGARV